MRVIRVGTRQSQVSPGRVCCHRRSNQHSQGHQLREPRGLVPSLEQTECLGVSFMGLGSLLPLKKSPWAREVAGIQRMASQARLSSSPCEKPSLFHIFLDPCEDLRLGQWPGEGGKHLSLCPQLARRQTDTVVATLKTLYPGMQFEISKFS